jgi:hypothetical protein
MGMEGQQSIGYLVNSITYQFCSTRVTYPLGKRIKTERKLWLNLVSPSHQVLIILSTSKSKVWELLLQDFIGWKKKKNQVFLAMAHSCLAQGNEKLSASARCNGATTLRWILQGSISPGPHLSPAGSWNLPPVMLYLNQIFKEKWCTQI